MGDMDFKMAGTSSGITALQVSSRKCDNFTQFYLSVKLHDLSTVYMLHLG